MTKRIIRISYFTMLTMIGSFLRVPIGTVYFTMQTLFVVLSGIVLGVRDGAISQVAYVILGLVGLPIFSSGGGLSYVFQPSFGYLLAFPLGSALSALLFYKRKTLSTSVVFVCALIGLLPIYSIGISYQLMILTNVLGLTFAGASVSLINILLYFVIDCLLCYIVALLYPRISTLLGKSD